MKDMSILMVIGGIITLIYINRKNIRFDFTFQFKAGEVPAEKGSGKEENFITDEKPVPEGETDRIPPVYTPNTATSIPSPPPAVSLSGTAVFGLSKTVFDRNTVPVAGTPEQPASQATTSSQQETGAGKKPGGGKPEEKDEPGEEELEKDGVHENPHYSLLDQLSTIEGIPPMADVPLELDNPTDPFRWVFGDNNDIALEEVNSTVVGSPGTLPLPSMNPTHETGTPVTLYWQRIEAVHRHAQSLNRLFRRRQRLKDLQGLTTQFLTMLTNLEMRGDANVVLMLDDFLAAFTPSSSGSKPTPLETNTPPSATHRPDEDEFAFFATEAPPPDEYQKLFANLQRTAAQFDAAESVPTNVAEDSVYS